MKDRSDHGVDREGITMEEVLEADLERWVETLPNTWKKEKTQEQG